MHDDRRGPVLFVSTGPDNRAHGRDDLAGGLNPLNPYQAGIDPAQIAYDLMRAYAVGARFLLVE